MNATTTTLPPTLSSEEVEGLIVSRLKNYVKGCTSHFSCGGSLSLDAPPSVTLAGDDGGAGGRVQIQVPAELRPGSAISQRDYETRPPYMRNAEGPTAWDESERKRAELFDRQAADLEDLIKVIPPAAFGKGGETVYDATVRDALQLKAENYQLDIPQEKIDDILHKVRVGLDLQTDVIAEPYSLNVYQKGGRFVKHKDTPRGDDMLGTLVLCLPTWFIGGKMVVSLDQETKNYFGKERHYSRDPEPPHPHHVEWCAFFADVDHEIFKVEEGIRITATYLLRRGDRSEASSLLPRAIRGQEQADRIRDCILAGLRDPRFLPDGGSVGFPCLHLYTNAEVFPKGADSAQALGPKQMAKLKGRDSMVAEAAASAGLSVRMLPYLSHEYSMDGGGDYPLSKFPAKKRCPWRMSDDTIESHFQTRGRNDPASAADMWILDFDSAASKQAGEAEWNCDGYFGNEASDVYFYVKACLIIEAPGYNDGRGAVVVAPQKKKAKKDAKAARPQPLSPGTQGRATSALREAVQSATNDDGIVVVDPEALRRAVDAGYSKHFILDKVAAHLDSVEQPTSIPAAVSED